MAKEDKTDLQIAMEQLEELDKVDDLIKKRKLGKSKEKLRAVKRARLGENSALGGSGRAALNGLLAGFGGEATAALGALAGGDYDDLKDDYNDRMDMFREDSPVLAYGSEIVGGIGSALGGGAAANLIRGGKAASGVGGVARGMLTGQMAKGAPAGVGKSIASNTGGGALAGGLYGAGENDDDRLSGALAGAGMGAVGGGVLGTAAERMMRPAMGAANLKSSPELSGSKSEDKAMKMLQARIDALGGEEKVMEKLKAANEAGVSPMSVLAGGELDPLNIAQRLYASGDSALVEQADKFVKGATQTISSGGDGTLIAQVNGMLQDVPISVEGSKLGMAKMLEGIRGKRGKTGTYAPIRAALARTTKGRGNKYPTDFGDLEGWLDELQQNSRVINWKGLDEELIEDLGELVSEQPILRKAYDEIAGNMTAENRKRDSFSVAHSMLKRVRDGRWRGGSGGSGMPHDALALQEAEGTLLEVMHDGLGAGLKKEFDTANAAEELIFKMKEAYEYGQAAPDLAHSNISTFNKHYNSLDSVQKQMVRFGVGKRYIDEIAANGSSLAGTLAGNTTDAAVLKTVGVDMEAMDAFVSMMNLQKEMVNRWAKGRNGGKYAKAGDMVQELVQVGGEISQQMLTLGLGQPPQAWTSGIIYGHFRNIIDKIKGTADVDKKLLDTMSSYQSTVDAIHKIARKSEKAISTTDEAVNHAMKQMGDRSMARQAAAAGLMSGGRAVEGGYLNGS